MSGFLRRLAGRAMGEQSPVRSVVRMPFAVPPAAPEESRIAVSPAPREPVAAVPETRISRPAASPPETAHAPDKTEPRPLLYMPQPAGPDRNQRLSPVSRADDASRAGAMPVQSVEQHERTYVEHESGAGHEPQRARDVAAPAVVPFVEPLLPPVAETPGPVPSPVGPQWPFAPRDTSAPTSQPTEVHVNIGRIELTAIHDAAPVKPARAAKPMSLDDYLARKRGGGP